ncbi:hypothetical protein LSG31_18140 [Fodinisporobacter ferrooxydans]|uniref:Uncharacterized protein n=1 Tax=Fodinisporobacter ferrooxydans TaxID=2901836 RepID=A0ABY4CGY2_9BACL|nr:hypothetical protein LSG31_18140 [Alicyclobacillaceae bacterium MYW30-H2]
MNTEKERAILSWFKSRSEAEKAVRALQGIGVETTQVAETSAYSHVEETDHLMNPITGHIPSLNSLTFGYMPTSRDAAILNAVKPDASGMTDGMDEFGPNSLTSYNYLLTVVTKDSLVEKSVDIIKQQGGLT